MAKTKTQFVCQNCGSSSPKWIGKCQSCGEWNTYVEEMTQTTVAQNFTVKKGSSTPVLLNDIVFKNEARIDTSNEEFNRVLGGGLVQGSIVLIGGEPGIGKSTLALQFALDLKKQKALYVSGEESLQQIKLRADRLKKSNNNCFFLSETSVESIIFQIEAMQPDVVVIDSIQTVHTEKIESTQGSVAQVRECTSLLLKIAKDKSIPIILIGHINKEGNIAGPKVLEHIVDAVFQFEGDQNYNYRILRSSKNRFGSASEIGIFEMLSTGLREVTNPSELLLTQHETELSGVSISASLEGMRAFLIEVQALVSSAAYGTPQRSSTGFDLRRLNMLLAVLEKKAGFRIALKDVFLNIAGGIKVNDPATDLSVICSILSSDLDIPIKSKTCFAGEVGLTGEVRPVNRIEQRILEAQKLGFEHMFVSKYNQKGLDIKKIDIELTYVSRIDEVFRRIFR